MLENKMSVAEETQEIGQSELTEEDRMYLRFAWKLLTGRPEGGQLPVGNLGRMLRGFGKNPSEQEVQFLIYNHKLDEAATLSYEEAVPLYMKCKSEVSSVNQLLEAFRVFDPDLTGKITVEDLRDILTRLGETLTTAEFEQLCKKADSAGDGLVVYKDFCKLVMGDNRPLP